MKKDSVWPVAEELSSKVLTEVGLVASKSQPTCNIITGTLSYPHIAEKDTPSNVTIKPSFNFVLEVTDEDTVAKLRAARDAMVAAEYPKATALALNELKARKGNSLVFHDSEIAGEAEERYLPKPGTCFVKCNLSEDTSIELPRVALARVLDEEERVLEGGKTIKPVTNTKQMCDAYFYAGAKVTIVVHMFAFGGKSGLVNPSSKNSIRVRPVGIVSIGYNKAEFPPRGGGAPSLEGDAI